MGVLASKLRDRLDQYVSGDAAGFTQKHTAEGQRLAEAAFGEAMLHTLGSAPLFLVLPGVNERYSRIRWSKFQLVSCTFLSNMKILGPQRALTTSRSHEEGARELETVQ